MYINPENLNNKNTYLSEYCFGGRRKYLNAENMSAALKFATTALNYSYLKAIKIDKVHNNSLRSGVAIAFVFLGYSDRDIQK